MAPKGDLIATDQKLRLIDAATGEVLDAVETLGEDDFVTVLTFSDETKPLVECFTDSDGEAELVQATNENIAEFTEAIDNIETMEIANFTSALTAAFTLLERYRTKKVRTSLLLTTSAHHCVEPV